MQRRLTARERDARRRACPDAATGTDVLVIATWREVAVSWLDQLPQYGQLQRDLAAHVDDLLALGVSDMRATIMPRRFDEALAAAERHSARRGPVEHPRLRRRRDRRGEVLRLGDSVVAHPFASMLLVLSWVRDRLAFGPGAPEIVRVRDAFLEVFSDLAPHAELVETLELACHVGKAAHADLGPGSRVLGEAEAGDHADAPMHCLRALLDDAYLGGA